LPTLRGATAPLCGTANGIINSKGELLRIKLTPGNVDDRKSMPELCQGLFGQLYADKGYIARGLTETLAEQGLQLIAPVKKNMNPVPDRL